MNYDHGYHAGNFADVMKHWALTLLLAKLKEKETPFAVMDTHAGSGLYDLSAEAANKTGEYKNGIARFLANPPSAASFQTYHECAKRYAPVYPGSAAIAHRMLRPEDRLILCELHPDACEDLRRHFKRDKQVQIHERNGYAALKAFLPPPEKRGLILIDPPFEAPDEFTTLAEALTNATQRFPQGIYMAWYPVKGREKLSRFYADMSLIQNVLIAELEVDASATLPASGLLFINPPWKLKETLEADLPALLESLGYQDTGRVTLRTLSPE